MSLIDSRYEGNMHRFVCQDLMHSSHDTLAALELDPGHMDHLFVAIDSEPGHVIAGPS
jgi:hypothetical protein